MKNEENIKSTKLMVGEDMSFHAMGWKETQKSY